ncbi:YceI family protein [Streptomyces boncukensis]|uniref:YceI family protein n=1 Tax=Streptomyces boncukensis TaxID=2711219 RepID=A0A6G4X0B4_9ACTN|nr:YceI family protein [Streptomyces boncukensis]NGO70828.1 YceI family protein [Streptomyces boncukensis]
MSTPSDLALPGYTTGTWTIDPVHSEISFTVKHLGIAKVRGRFDAVEGQIVTAENPLESTVSATVHTPSVSTGNDQRDGHVRAEDFLHTEQHPEMTFRSTGVRAASGDRFSVDGELTLRGVTRPVTLDVELNGFGTGMDGKPAIGLSASTEINRSDFGVTAGPAGAVVGEAVRITLEIEANQV